MATLPEVPDDDPIGLGEEEDPDDYDEDSQLLGRKPSKIPVRVTSTTRGERNYEDEGARPKTQLTRGKIVVRSMENEKDTVLRDILNKFPEAKPSFHFRYNEWGKIEVAIPRSKPDERVWHNLFNKNGDVNKKLPATILNALGKKAGEVVQTGDNFLSQLNEKNEEIRDLRNALDGLRAVVETSQFEIDRYVSIERELRGMIERNQTTIAEKDSYLEAAVRQKIDAKQYAETLLNDLKELKTENEKGKKDLASLKNIEQSRDRLAKRVETYDELARKQLILNEK